MGDANWRPYMDGYWAYTDVGYTWISYEDFGWATYHYGRWAKLADYGWVWFPGTDLEWGPAWVSWRYGTGVVGWAPLPPRGPGIVFEGQAIGVDVDPLAAAQVVVEKINRHLVSCRPGNNGHKQAGKHYRKQYSFHSVLRFVALDLRVAPIIHSRAATQTRSKRS